MRHSRVATTLILICALGSGPALGAKAPVALLPCDPACEKVGLWCCGGVCVDLQSDVNNCGECGNACGEAESCHQGHCTYDLVAACFNTGQVRGIQAATDITGPLASIGTGPQALAWDENVLLVADGIDRKLRQARLPELSVLPRMNDLGNSPNHVWVDDPYVYVVNAISNTLQVLRRTTNETDAGLELTTVGELNFGPNTSPQAIAKVGNNIFVPLFGGLEGSGGVSQVDVSNPFLPIIVRTTGFGSLDLQPFDGGTTYPRPSGIAAFQGDLYVALANLDSQYQAGGPGMLAKIDLDGGTPSAIYMGEVCLNTAWVAATDNALYVSCAGRVLYDASYRPVSSEKTGLVLVDGADGGISSWNARCPSNPQCVPPSIYRFAIAGDRLYAGDISGRIFVVQNVDNQLVERRGYDPIEGGPPLDACPPSLLGYAFVSDIIAIP